MSDYKGTVWFCYPVVWVCEDVESRSHSLRGTLSGLLFLTAQERWDGIISVWILTPLGTNNGINDQMCINNNDRTNQVEDDCLLPTVSHPKLFPFRNSICSPLR